MTTQQAADKLGVSVGRIRQLITADRLKASLRGKQYHITPGQLEKVRERPLGTPGAKVGDTGQNLRELCEKRGLRYHTVWARLKRGWELERALGEQSE